jgi:hypothetical protein
MVFRVPAAVFTSLVAGRTAFLIYLCFAVAQLCIGIGLLRLRPAARIGAIAYLVFGFVNTAVFYFAPGGHARLLALLESEHSIFPWMRPFQDQAQYQLNFTPPLILGSIVGLVLIGVQLYFLITRKRAFEISSSGPLPGTPSKDPGTACSSCSVEANSCYYPPMCTMVLDAGTKSGSPM